MPVLTNPLIKFEQVNSPDLKIELEASGDGEVLVFKNAILCRAEVNSNLDSISNVGISELAATIPGRPVDVEHDSSQNCGVFTDARPVLDGSALSVDGIVWADRYSAQANGIKNGTHGLSVEAYADKAKCSVCGGEFDESASYCEHLIARRKYGATRTLSGLKGKGGAITSRPAGTQTKFDPASIYFVASHADDKKPVIQESTNMNKCPHCGESSASDSKCSACGKSMEASVIATELKSALDALNAATQKTKELEASVVEANQKVSEITAEKEKLVADKDAALTEKEGKLSALSAQLRRTLLGAYMTDEEFEKDKATITSMADEAFNLMVASLAKKQPEVAVHGFRLVERVTPNTYTANGKKAIRLS